MEPTFFLILVVIFCTANEQKFNEYYLNLYLSSKKRNAHCIHINIFVLIIEFIKPCVSFISVHDNFIKSVCQPQFKIINIFLILFQRIMWDTWDNNIAFLFQSYADHGRFLKNDQHMRTIQVPLYHRSR